MEELVIEPTYPIKVPPSFKVCKVIVIGCGGTGSYFIRDVARSIATLNRKVELVLIDGDTVEEKNLRRQNFMGADIGANKAEVMANRYTALGIPIQCVPKFLESPTQLREIVGTPNGSVLIVSCVDNVKTRMLVREMYLANTGSIYWVDCGNEEFTGQVVLAHNAYAFTEASARTGFYSLPDPFDLYPELVEKAKTDKLPTELSCAELAASSPQFGFINATAALLALNYAHSLLTERPITTHVVDFSVNNSFSHRTLTESALYSWKTFFAPIHKLKFIDEAIAKRARPTLVPVVSKILQPSVESDRGDSDPRVKR